ncbi:MAG: hypothetical protein MJ178_10430 [Treponemataceae bacterium]|nr:hypothetical protein [Treponemataceae bacterium]
MKKKVCISIVLLALIGLTLTGCQTPYTGKYYDVVWGRAADPEFSNVWAQNLENATKKNSLVPISGDTVKSESRLTDSSLKSYLKNTVRFSDELVTKYMSQLEVFPDILMNYWYKSDPDVHYWVYIRVAD